jgi:steroid 5-alpha reductase family enzyme
MAEGTQAPALRGLWRGVLGSLVVGGAAVAVGWVAGGAPGAAVAAAAVATQWVAFVPAFRRQTERFYDLTGSATYLGAAWLGVWLGGASPRGLLLGAVVTAWAVRLGAFLFRRVHADGGDGRFDAIKPDAGRFLIAWSLQGLWVVVTLSAALAAMMSSAQPPFGALDVVGVVVWLAGFALEAIADAQKRAFRADPAQRGRFIQSGLWAWSRHPNYFGEITLWVGVALIASSAMQGWQWLTWWSPLFVWALINHVSGVPLLEARADARWGDDPTYQAYRARTRPLLPWPPRP